MVLDALGAPDARLGAIVHVAGTNGKGSTARFVEAMARAAGLHTALTTSPHLARLTERIELDGVEVDAEALGVRYAALLARAPSLAALTFFEQVTVLAFDAIAAAAPDVTVIEVGLGGRLDATNVVDPRVAIVTGVALDHQAVLGGTLAEIAGEKAGIWKRGRAAVVGVAGEEEAVPGLVRAAEVAGASEIVRVRGDEADAAHVLGLAGAHQRGNAAAAWTALDALARAGGPVVDEGARVAGLAAARWPGRLETIGDVTFDAAHNPAAAAALARGLDGEVVIVVGVAADKDVRGVLRALAPRARAIVATQAAGPRALAADALAAIAREAAPGRVVVAEAELDRAMVTARTLAGPGGRVVVTGSFLVVGPLRARLRGEPEDPLTVSDPVPVSDPAYEPPRL